MAADVALVWEAREAADVVVVGILAGQQASGVVVVGILADRQASGVVVVVGIRGAGIGTEIGMKIESDKLPETKIC
jgi:hypothetical protein